MNCTPAHREALTSSHRAAQRPTEAVRSGTAPGTAAGEPAPQQSSEEIRAALDESDGG